MKNRKIVLGLMSGTSCDGLTVCAVLPSPFKILCFKNYPYSSALQKKLLKAPECTVAELSALHFELGKLYAQKTLLFLKQTKLKKEEILAAKEQREPIIFERITPHTLRHTFATRAFESGIPPKVVQQILGHSSLEMTMDLYTHVTEDVQSREIQKLAVFF